MALRFLADDCISNSIIQTLAEANHEVLCLRKVLPAESSNAAVITKAREMDAILLSLNGDLADIVSYPPKNYKGIVALQMRNYLRFFLISCQTDSLFKGSACDRALYGKYSWAKLIVSAFRNRRQAQPSGTFARTDWS
jgi:hypothetical protein